MIRARKSHLLSLARRKQSNFSTDLGRNHVSLPVQMWTNRARARFASSFRPGSRASSSSCAISRYSLSSCSMRCLCWSCFCCNLIRIRSMLSGRSAYAPILRTLRRLLRYLEAAKCCFDVALSRELETL